MSVMDARLDPVLAKIPESLRRCFYSSCRNETVLGVFCRHGSEFPTCLDHAGQALIAAFKQDGDYGHVEVVHLWMFYGRGGANLDE